MDQTSSFYLLSLYQCYIVLKISKVGKCHRDNVISSEATKTYRPKARISHFKNTSGQQFCPRISGLHTFGRKQLLLRFSTMHFSVNESIYISKTKFRIVADKPLLSCDLDVYIQLLGWIVLINYFDTRHTTVFDQFECFSIGLMHHHQWSKSRCSERLARLDLSPRVCGRIWSRKWSKRTEKKPTLHYKSIRKKFPNVAR